MNISLKKTCSEVGRWYFFSQGKKVSFKLWWKGNTLRKLPRFLVAWQHWNWSIGADRCTDKAILMSRLQSWTEADAQGKSTHGVSEYLFCSSYSCSEYFVEWIWFVHLLTLIYPFTNHVHNISGKLIHKSLNICKLPHI